jgi:Na+/H+ antiporter NhaA
VSALPEGRTAWARNLAAPVRSFVSTATGGAGILLIAVVAALAWANSPWSDSYESVWTTKMSIQVGGSGIALDLRHWVNQGLMTFFFLVVGLEAKRELDLGELRERRRIATSAAAAIGGAITPVLIYLAINHGGDGAHGWGAVMSTDTAFALGVLALVAPQGTRLRVALLSYAVVDDLAALIVIATVYTADVKLVPAAVAVGLFAVLVGLRWTPVPYKREVGAVLGAAVWVALFKSGVDPVIAGLAVGLVVSAYTPERSQLERVTELARSFREQPTPELARSAQLGVASAISPNERIQYRLHPWTSYVIVPLFALANAGIHVQGKLVEDAVSSPITLGIVFGYLVGKPVGIFTGVWLASRPRLGGARRALSWPATAGAGIVGSIGFTVALLVSSIAFHGQELAEAKLGILTAAVCATGLSWLAFRIIRHVPAERRARQISGTREDILDLADEVDSARDHVRGPDDAPVTLLEYGDYQCPYCGQAEEAIRDVLDEFGDDLRYAWRHLPLNDVHEHAQMAAEAAEAASAQGAFWPMHDLLLAHQDEIEGRDLRGYAEQLGLDVKRFVGEVRDREHAPRIAEDVRSADESGVAGTPSFFINGRRYNGAYDVEGLTSAVRGARFRAQVTRGDHEQGQSQEQPERV